MAIWRGFFLDNARPNTHGKRLIELCKASCMLTISGRCGTDKGVGGYTRVGTTGSSTVDYAICSPGWFLCVNALHIYGKFPESNHLPVSLSLSCDKTAGMSFDYTDSDDWQFHTTYTWGADELIQLKAVIIDPISTEYCQNFLELISEEASVNDVASALNKCVNQACDRIYRKSSAGTSLPLLVMLAGDTVHVNKTKRDHTEWNAPKIQCAYMYDRSSIWSVIDKLIGYHRQQKMPTKHELRHHFVDLVIPPVKHYFCEDYCEHVRIFLLDHDRDGNFINGSKLELEVINKEFTLEGSTTVIDALNNNNKSPGCDGIPAEFIKARKNDLAGLIVCMFNYMVEKRIFQMHWQKGPDQQYLNPEIDVVSNIIAV